MSARNMNARYVKYAYPEIVPVLATATKPT